MQADHTEAEDAEGTPFGARRVREVVRAGAPHDAQAVYNALAAALAEHTQGAVQKDDITVMVVEYRSERE